MPAEHETMTAEQIEALKIWAPYWSDADCRNALATIASQQAALAVAREKTHTAALAFDAFAAFSEKADLCINASANAKILRGALATIDAALKGAHPAQGGENVG